MEETTPLSFTGACMSFFGRKPGEGLQEFAKEVAALIYQDRLDLLPHLEAALGRKVTPPEVK